MTWDGVERRRDPDGLNEMRTQLKEIHHVLTGNGTPEKGLHYKVALNTNFRNFWQKFGWLVVGGMVSVPFAVFTGVIVWQLRAI